MCLGSPSCSPIAASSRPSSALHAQRLPSQRESKGAYPLDGQLERLTRQVSLHREHSGRLELGEDAPKVPGWLHIRETHGG
jgi:hypothetical protein